MTSSKCVLIEDKIRVLSFLISMFRCEEPWGTSGIFFLAFNERWNFGRQRMLWVTNI